MYILNVKRHKYLQIYTTYINENHILNYAIFIHITKGYPQSYQTQWSLSHFFLCLHCSLEHFFCKIKQIYEYFINQKLNTKISILIVNFLEYQQLKFIRFNCSIKVLIQKFWFILNVFWIINHSLADTIKHFLYMVEWYAGKNSIKEKRTSRLHLKN